MWLAWPAQCIEKSEMACHHLTPAFLVMVGQAKLQGGCPDQICKLRIEGVADAWEEVMFDLIVKATRKPIQEWICVAEVSRREHHVGCPVHRHLAGGRARRFLMKQNQLIKMSELKDRCKNQAECGVKYEETANNP